MNSSSNHGVSDGRTDRNSVSFDITDGRGLAGLLELALGGTDGDGDGDRDGSGRAGDDLHVCGALCGLPFGPDSGPGVVWPWVDPAPAGGDSRGSASTPVGPPRHARKLSRRERRALDREARRASDVDFRAALDGSW